METYFDASDQWGFSYTYSTQVPRCNGEWTTTTWYDVPVINLCTPKCVDVASVNYWNGGLYLPFSQTFFNDDEKFEYVRFKAEVAEGVGGPAQSVDGSVDAAEYLFGITANDRDGDGEEDYRVTVYGIRYSGLEVVSEDGDVIYSFPIPDNCEDRASIQFFKSDNSILAQADFNWYNEENKQIHTTRFYRIDKSSRVAEVIRDEHRVSATPNPANRGVPVEMTIPIGSGQPRTVRVTAMNGEQIYSIPVATDATKVSVPTANLSPGLYLFTLTENGHTLQTCKIIIR